MDDAIDGCFGARLTVGVAGAVPVFVMELDGAEVGHEAVDAFEDAAADDGVLFDDVPLLVGEAAGLLQDAVGDADFADVVEKRADADALDVRGGQIHGGGDGAGKLADTMAVAGGVAIARVESAGERADKFQIGGLEFFA